MSNTRIPVKVRLIKFLLTAGVLLLLSACAPETAEPIQDLISPTPILSPTATIDWFPATATPTIVVPPTATQNPAAVPVYGELLFTDSFNTSGNWQDQQNVRGIVSAANESITLAVKADRGSLIAFRQNTLLTDFYMETTVKRVALCKENDQFGVVFRAQDEQNFYRLMINCQGAIAVQQMVGSTPSFLLDWTPSSDISLWQPYTIGIWAKGQTLRVYINQKLQTEVVRGTFASGGIGYFAKAAGDTPLTVSFSDLNVYDLPKTIGNNLPTTTIQN